MTKTILINSVTIGPVVSEKSFEIVDEWPMTENRRCSLSILLCSPEAFGSCELKTDNTLKLYTLAQIHLEI